MRHQEYKTAKRQTETICESSGKNRTFGIKKTNQQNNGNRSQWSLYCSRILYMDLLALPHKLLQRLESTLLLEVIYFFYFKK